MEEDGYYILLNDITLENWTPISTAIASLDGNGYVITIDNDSFYDTTLEPPTGEEEATEQLSLGIFSTISEKTTIKNLTIEVKPSNEVLNDYISNMTGDVEISTQYYSEVKFGLLAGENNGIVTNVSITNNANALRNERNSLLYSRGLINGYEELSLINEVTDEDSKVWKRNCSRGYIQ